MVQKQLLEAALLAHPSVNDCVVIVRETQLSRQELVAYVVSTGAFSEEQLQSYLQGVLPNIQLPIAFVAVSSLPLTNQGQVDEQALTQLEVLDSDLMQRWEEQLKAVPNVERVAVVVQDSSQSIPPLHLSDILPNWKTVPAGTLEEPIDADESTAVPPEESHPKALAISCGEPLPQEPENPTNLALALQRTALQAPEKGILYLNSDGSEFFQTYKALLEESKRILAGLRKLGLKAQDKVIFQLSNNRDFIPAFWGCMLGGFVPVPISIAPTYEPSNSTVKKLHHAWEMLEQPLILTNNSLKSELCSVSERLGLANVQVETLEHLRSHEPDSTWHRSQPDDLAVLILTSGSTGIPKGVMLSHGNILSNVSASAKMNNFTRDDVSLNWLHLDHVGSLIRCSIRDIFVGSQQIHAPAEAVLENPLRWLDWIEQYQVTFAWAPNFALGLVNAHAEAIGQRTWDLSAVKSILSVAEPIVPKTAKKFLELLAPHGLSANTMHSAWGMSETCAAVAFSHRYLFNLPSDNYPFVEVGAPVPGFKMRIVDAQDRVVQEDTIGRLQITGLMITDGYYQNPELNREAFTEDGWLKTGDLGFLHDGRLTITGREKDIIIINGLNHYSHEIEAVVEDVEGVEVSYTAACAIREPESDTDQLAIFFHPQRKDKDGLAALLKEIRGNVVRKIRVNPAYLIPVEKEAIPKTAIGKIQRSQLKQRFEAGEFDSILKQLDILTGNANTLPDWFYKKIWRRQEAVTLTSQSTTGQSLVFLDPLGLGQLVCNQLSQLRQPCVRVEAGSQFAQLDANHYSLDPKNPNHYRQLFESLKAANLSIDQIVHLWTYGEYTGEVTSLAAIEQAQEWGAYSLLFLVQALSQVQGSRENVQLYVISSYTQPISPTDEIAYEKSPILGLIKTFPKELPWLDCRHVDLCPEQLELNAAQVLHELKVIQREPEVAYRHGQRLVVGLEKVDLPSSKQQELPIKPGGMYLITGGLGGIGVEIAKYWLQHYKSRLLLLGRTPLPERSTWDEHLRQADAVSTRIKAFLSLEQLGGEIIYESVDICDLDRLQQVVDRAKSHWQCELDGVIHLAGIGRERLLIEETRDSLATTLRPKVLGSWVLYQLLDKHSKGIFISFSSVISFFGVFNVGAYAAANSFLDCFWHYQRYKDGKQSYCFAPSTWAGVGISRGYEYRDSRLAQGREVMSAEQGLHSFLASLNHEPAHLIVGLDGSNPHIRCRLQTKFPRVKKLSAYFTTQAEQVAVAKLQELEVRDRFGTVSTCNFIQLQEMPLTETGEIDQEQLTTKGFRSTAERVAPRTDLERKIATVWQDVLGVPQVGIHDNFFELGGSSLLAVQLLNQIEQVCGKYLPLSILFQAATVEQLASILHWEEELGRSSSLVLIQSGGSKPPIFGIHEVQGHILFYRELAHHLGSEQPFYGLQPVGLDGKQAPLTRCEDMAAHYIEQMRTIQPEGPYFLVGYSVGGVLAFEMAQQLYAQGQKVALLALLDTFTVKDSRRFTFRKRMVHHLTTLLRLEFSDILANSKNKIQTLKHRVRERTQEIVHKFYPVIEPPVSDAPCQLSLEAFVEETIRQAVNDYVFQVYPGRVTFFQASDPIFFEGFTPDAYSCWGNRSTEGLELYEIPGDHVSMVHEPYVQVLAEKLKACIEQRQTVNSKLPLVPRQASLGLKKTSGSDRKQMNP